MATSETQAGRADSAGLYAPELTLGEARARGAGRPVGVARALARLRARDVARVKAGDCFSASPRYNHGRPTRL